MLVSPSRLSFGATRVPAYGRVWLSLVLHGRIVGKKDPTDAALIGVEKAIRTGFTDEARTIACRDGEALLGRVTGGAGS